jgi:nucleoside 2-deoxyribosyltransferase
MKSLYLMGALKNPKIPVIGNELRKMGFDVFDDWFSPGPEADDFWRKYEKVKGTSYKEALDGWAAKHIFEFDKSHLDRCDMAVLVMPSGKSCHLELGYMIGCGKPCWVLFDNEPDRWDIMYRFANGVFFDIEELKKELEKYL